MRIRANAGLWSSNNRWPLATCFCPCATVQSIFFSWKGRPGFNSVTASGFLRVFFEHSLATTVKWFRIDHWFVFGVCQKIQAEHHDEIVYHNHQTQNGTRVLPNLVYSVRSEIHGSLLSLLCSMISAVEGEKPHWKKPRSITYRTGH